MIVMGITKVINTSVHVSQCVCIIGMSAALDRLLSMLKKIKYIIYYSLKDTTIYMHEIVICTRHYSLHSKYAILY